MKKDMQRLLLWAIKLKVTAGSTRSIQAKLPFTPLKAKKIVFATDNYLKLNATDIFIIGKFTDLDTTGFSDDVNQFELNGDYVFEVQGETEYFGIDNNPTINFTNEQSVDVDFVFALSYLPKGV